MISVPGVTETVNRQSRDELRNGLQEAVAAYMQVYQSGTCYLGKMVADTSRLSHGDNENFSN